MNPPTIARAIVRLLSDPEDRDSLLNDLAERFKEVQATKGPEAAKRWYWSQALSAIPWAFHPDGGLMRLGRWAGLMGEVRSGFRLFTRRPLYALGVSGTLGLGLAAATITVAIAWGVWFAPMSYPDPDRVVRLYELEPPGTTVGTSQGILERRHRFSTALIEDFRAHQWRTISAVSASITGLEAEWTWDRRSHHLTEVVLSPEGFGILGISPVLGRLPVEVEREVLLAEPLWRKAFASDPEVVGTELKVGHLTVRVVGVARIPAGYPGRADLAGVIEWREDDREIRFIEAIARIRPGYSVADARTEVNAFLKGLSETHPEHRGWNVDVAVLEDDLFRPFRDVILLLLAAGATFLLLAAVNVIGLVAARRIEARQDYSIRFALGASKGRLFRGSLVEGLLLSGLGACGGVFVAWQLIGPIKAIVPYDLPRLMHVDVTPPLMFAAFSVAATLGAVIAVSGHLAGRGITPVVGRTPAWRAVGTGGHRALVIGQVALTTLLTAGCVAILNRASTLKAVDLGFQPEGVSSTLLSAGTEPRHQLAQATWRDLLEGLNDRGIPAAVAFNMPMRGQDKDLPPFGIPADGTEDKVFYQLHPVSPAYFSVMGIEVIAGRGFRDGDDSNSANVVLVSEEFAHRYLSSGRGAEGIVGRTVEPVMLMNGPATVVGVVRSTRHHGPDAPVVPEVYIPFAQQVTVPPRELMVRGTPDQVEDALSAVVSQMDSDVHWDPAIPYISHLGDWYAPLRLQVTMVGVLAGLGLLIASLGLYTLMAYQVVVRRRELGIRKAVGAGNGRLLGKVLSSGIILTLIGVILGLGTWYELRPWTRGLVDGFEGTGLLVPVSVITVVGGCSLVATLIPALHATQVDPVEALRAD